MSFSAFRFSFISGVLVSIALFFFALFLFFTLNHEASLETLQTVDSRVYGLLSFTLYQAFLSTVISLFIGFLLAWSLVHQRDFKGRSIFIALFSSSLVLPTIIVVFGLIGIYGKNGYINQVIFYLFDVDFGSYIYGLGGILLAHTYLNASFASRGLLHSLESISTDKYKLSKSLNLSLLERFYLIEYPAIKSTLVSMGTTIFLLCFSSFAIVLLLGGNPSYNTLEVAIYEAIKLDFDIDFALKLAYIQLFMSSILVMLSSAFETTSSSIKKSKNGFFLEEKKGVKYVQYSIIFIFTLFFISPLGVIIIDGLGANFREIFRSKLFLDSLFTSLGIAFISSSMSLILIIFLSASRRNLLLNLRLKKRWWSKFLNLLMAFVGNIYLCISSLIIGLGMFLLSLEYDVSMVLLSAIAVISANVLLSLPFGLSLILPLMQKSALEYDKLSFSLGIRGWERWKMVEYPYLKASMGYIFALSFCFSLGDFGVIALFGSDEFTTLPWYLYGLMGSYQTQEASGVALIILVIVLAVFIFIPKLFNNKKGSK